MTEIGYLLLLCILLFLFGCAAPICSTAFGDEEIGEPRHSVANSVWINIETKCGWTL